MSQPTDSLIDLYEEKRPVPVRVCVVSGEQALFIGRSCNGCGEFTDKIWLITVNGDMQTRLCASCKKMLKEQLK